MIRKREREPRMWIDAALYVGGAALAAFQAALAQEAATEHLGPEALFWIRTMIGVVLASGLAMKAYRSTSFSDQLKAKKKEPPKP